MQKQKEHCTTGWRLAALGARGAWRACACSPSSSIGSSNQTGLRNLNTKRERLVGVNDRLGQRDFFKARFDLEIQLRIPICCRMRRIVGQSLPSGLFAANTLQDSPRLTERFRKPGRPVQLVGPRKSPSVEKDASRRSLAEKVARNFQHDAHAKVVLLGGIVNIIRREQRSADLVFIEYRAAELGGEPPTQPTLAGAGKSCHQD